jgi:hypothetical protein
MDISEIKTICGQLNDKALDEDFFNEPVEVLESRADVFVQDFCRERSLSSHLISPFRWSFDKDGHEIRSGVIEFEPKADSKSIRFTWVDVSGSKITEASPESVRRLEEREHITLTRNPSADGYTGYCPNCGATLLVEQPSKTLQCTDCSQTLHARLAALESDPRAFRA